MSAFNKERILDDLDEVQLCVVDLVRTCHGLAHCAGWWTNADGTPKEINVGEKLMLIVSEVAEAMEGDRKGIKDDHLPKRDMLEVELADAMIRILDLAGGLNLDIAGAMVEKLAYNANREDHKPENREAAGGKKY